MRQPIISIAIKELKQLKGFALRHMIASIVTKEVHNLVTRDVGLTLPINPLKSRMQRKIRNEAEALTSLLNISLALAQQHKHILESTLRFVS